MSKVSSSTLPPTLQPYKKVSKTGQFELASAIALSVGLTFYYLSVRVSYGAGLGLLWAFCFGFVMRRAFYGMTGAFRLFVLEGKTLRIRSVLLAFALASAFFAAILIPDTSYWTITPRAFVAPPTFAVFIGSFLFGSGIQLGGTCLFGAFEFIGAGQVSWLWFVGAAILGAASVTQHLHLYADAFGDRKPISLILDWDEWYYGVLLQIAVILFALAVFLAIEFIVHKKIERDIPLTFKTFVHGPWPLWVGGVAAAVLNALCLLSFGIAWNSTGGLSLFGAKIFQNIFDLGVTDWTYWSRYTSYLNGNIFAESSAVYTLGIAFGAAFEAAITGCWQLSWASDKTPRSEYLRGVITKLIGGFMAGYGSFVAGACNWGFFSSFASYSVHAYIWFAGAISGTFVTLYLSKFIEWKFGWKLI